MIGRWVSPALISLSDQRPNGVRRCVSHTIEIFRTVFSLVGFIHDCFGSEHRFCCTSTGTYHSSSTSSTVARTSRSGTSTGSAVRQPVGPRVVPFLGFSYWKIQEKYIFILTYSKNIFCCRHFYISWTYHHMYTNTSMKIFQSWNNSSCSLSSVRCAHSALWYSS